ncbi:putative Pre-mRNA-splicing factor 38B [Blattamonas nauphoetae]|uniref:Pre-mRNA-splicing factor 38 n=1 Tax=Blattamonas nauphoetae TaxID=2049346 RepID=A0ABQ9YCN9_9EUKA|nr:putative Pre-mRNA-splicing factor 38B [Blattamonas nauphoetae]
MVPKQTEDTSAVEDVYDDNGKRIPRRDEVPVEADVFYNLDRVLAEAILKSVYFKSLFELRTYHEVLEEIKKEVDYLEPYIPNLLTTPSSAFTLLYKLFTMHLTHKQLNGMLRNSNVYIRALGVLYLRLTLPPGKLWDYLSDYLGDTMEISADQKHTKKDLSNMATYPLRENQTELWKQKIENDDRTRSGKNEKKRGKSKGEEEEGGMTGMTGSVEAVVIVEVILARQAQMNPVGDQNQTRKEEEGGTKKAEDGERETQSGVGEADRHDEEGTTIDTVRGTAEGTEGRIEDIRAQNLREWTRDDMDGEMKEMKEETRKSAKNNWRRRWRPC